MIIDSRTLSEGDVVDADLCIVGGGAAGITLALEMIETGLKVVLVESGDMHFEGATQALYDAPLLGFKGEPLDEVRLRFLGGSTNHWAGVCFELTDMDFEAREALPNSGWPIKKPDLQTFYDRAKTYVEIPGDFDRVEQHAADLDLPLMALDSSKLLNTTWGVSPPTAFGYTYEDQLRAAPNLTVLLNANAQTLEADDSATTVTHLKVACIEGPKFTVEAKRFVVSLGGIETPRLLLLSNSVAPAGLGNQNDLVGRYFQDHPSLRPPVFWYVLDDDANFDLYTQSQTVAGGEVRCAIVGAPDYLREKEIGNFIAYIHQTNETPGKIAGREMFAKLKSGDFSDIADHLANIATDLDGFANAVYGKTVSRQGHLISRPWLAPWVAIETVPDPESRVKLIEERDLFGQQKLGLDWRVSEADMRTMKHATEALQNEFSRLGYGRTWSDVLDDDYEWPEVVLPGKHHSGTTRMSDDPKKGVVDKNCQVHGMSNLYVASGAVFPTQGFANPTLTIVALSIRLAEHLKNNQL